jgi:arginine decarboxylase-like protein|tara:strand:+ start:300 stop:569 length:270 start_codon:yes stop_codon:yes gene_type:complete
MEITEKQLRKLRHKLFEAMDKKIIEFSPTKDVKEIQEHTLINDVIKYVGLEPTDLLTKQLKAEYKTWKQQLNTKIKDLRQHEKDSDTNI